MAGEVSTDLWQKMWVQFDCKCEQAPESRVYPPLWNMSCFAYKEEDCDFVWNHILTYHLYHNPTGGVDDIWA